MVSLGTPANLHSRVILTRRRTSVWLRHKWVQAEAVYGMQAQQKCQEPFVFARCSGSGAAQKVRSSRWFDVSQTILLDLAICLFHASLQPRKRRTARPYAPI